MQVLMETSAGNITIDLFHGSAPDTVANFVKLVKMGHYDGLHFHRVIEDFMIQGGCPHSKDPMARRAGTAPRLANPCEPSALALKHDKPGVLSMANAGRNTGGSQFFLTTVPTPGSTATTPSLAPCPKAWTSFTPSSDVENSPATAPLNHSKSSAAPSSSEVETWWSSPCTVVQEAMGRGAV